MFGCPQNKRAPAPLSDGTLRFSLRFDHLHDQPATGTFLEVVGVGLTSTFFGLTFGFLATWIVTAPLSDSAVTFSASIDAGSSTTRRKEP